MPTFGQAVSRGMRLRCPLCGEGRLFRSAFRMHEACSSCGYRFEREAGYFLGSIYVNYGLTAILVVAVVLCIELGFDRPRWFALLVGFGVATMFALWFFRYARALWMAFDVACDPPGEDERR